jgi:TonB family protein
MPRHDGIHASAFGATSLLFHATALMALLLVARASGVHTTNADSTRAILTPVEPARLVFLAAPSRPDSGGGGGGGGNRQHAPISRAQAPGRDAVTLPIAKPIVAAVQPLDARPAPQALLLDARPLTSGVAFQAGSLDGVVGLGPSQGPGAGGGVGEGLGAGIGSGRGPGIGPGSGGGIGGGLYRLGNGVISPRLLVQVRPAYTPEAMRGRIQGSVVLEAVVQADGTPRDIRVVRSLDPFGLDREAVLAVEQWRFDPGRLNGAPVNVLVTIVLDFNIR